MANESKPGSKTSELKLIGGAILAVLGILLEAIINSGALSDNEMWLRAVTMGATVLASIGYGGVRAITKGNDVKARAIVAAAHGPQRASEDIAEDPTEPQ